MMKLLLLFVLVTFAHAMEQKSNISTKYIGYSDFADEKTVEGDTKLKFENDFFATNIALEYLYSSEYDEKKYIHVNELYLMQRHVDYSLTLGKTVQYWGELEGYNVADVFNQKNILLNPFDKSAKLGALGLLVSKYFDENSLEFGVKLYEENQKYPKNTTPFSPFAINYNEDLKLSDARYTPTMYLAYNFATNAFMDSETKLILLQGYDSKRYFILTAPSELSQYAYRVNKFMLLSNIVYQETIFKCETSYTDVLSDKVMSDYTQLTFGMENSLDEILGVGLNLYTEYYRYIYMDDKIKNVDISEIYDNDIFLALKLNFNDVRNSEIKSGILYDMINEEKVFKIEAQSRVIDNLVLSGEYLRLLPANKTVLSQIKESNKVMIGLTYSF
ncbi:MAG: hypothetical protein Q7S59_01065 [Sulfurimonas sp.]|nr:hypothetical protein [Sulfurimonas sp.]